MNTESSISWEPCQSDFLAGISSQKHVAKRRRRSARRVAAASACLAFLAIGVWGVSSLTRGPAENYFGGVSCSQVRESIPEMMAGGLAPKLSEQIEVHLQQCPRCQQLLEEMRAMAPQVESIGLKLPASPEESVAMVESGPARYSLAIAR